MNNNNNNNRKINPINIVMNYIKGLNLTGNQLFNRIKKDLYPAYINCKMFNNTAILSTNSKFEIGDSNNIKNLYIKKNKFIFKTICNGLIIDLESLNILSIFPKFSDSKCSLNKLNNNILKKFYLIKERKYGSQITLYWNNGKWIISTINGINNNNITWNGIKTFENSINDVIGCMSNNEFDFNTFCENLDKNHCYTLGFTDPAYHPATDQYDIWFVGSFNLSNYKRIYKKNIDFDFISEETITNISLDNIKNNCINSIDNYINNNNNRCYGYLLVNKYNNCYNNILIESELMLNIIKYGHFIDYTVINKYKINRELYLAMRIYINSYKINEYLKTLFSYYSEYFNKFDKYFEFIISHIRTLIETNYENFNDNTFVYDFIKHNKANFNKHDNNLEQIIKDIVISDKYLTEHCINFPKTGTLLTN